MGDIIVGINTMYAFPFKIVHFSLMRKKTKRGDREREGGNQSKRNNWRRQQECVRWRQGAHLNPTQ